MSNSLNQEKNPWLALMIICAFTAIGLIVFQIIGVSIVLFFSEDGFQGIVNKISNPYAYPNFKWVIIFIQLLVSVGAFIIAPLFFIWKFENKNFDAYFSFKNFKSNPAIITILLVLSFMVVNSLFIEWNANFEFPAFMSGFGEWAREKEDTLEQLTLYILELDSFAYFLLIFLVVAIVPGIGEELLFRGLIQNQINRLSGNVHVAIWVSAILFSAIHMQFFGFIPRVLLGAFFGYLYVFSGSLWYAILAHFVNNGFTILMFYFYQNEIISYNIENSDSVPITMVGFFIIIGSVLFYLFYKQVKSLAANKHE